MLHLFNYSINIEDRCLWTDISFGEEYNEIETFSELALTLLFQEEGALPDEADDIDETKAAAGILAVMPAALNFNSHVFAFREPTTFQDYRNGYLDLVFDICPPPPKAWV